VLQEFVMELERGEESLAVLASTLETEALRATTHRLLGVARTIGARRLAQALEVLQREIAGSASPLPALATVREVMGQTLPALGDWASRAATAQQENDSKA